jgi:transaldolase
MKFFLDTAEVEKIRKWNELGMVDGVTTNPTLVAKAGKDHEQTIREICKMVKGPISVEGAGQTAEEIVKEAEEFSTWGKNVVAKVPMTVEGLKACAILKKKGIPVNVTLVFSSAQAILAAKAGAIYVSPFIGRLDDVGERGMDLIEEIVQIYSNYNFETQVLVASVRSPLHVVEAGLAGAQIVTMPPDVLEKMYKHPFTDAGIEKFLADYKNSKKK